MNEAQEKVVEQETTEENVIVDIDESEEKKEEAPKVAAKEEERTDVRSEQPEEELENYSENVQKRINQLTAKRKQALEEADAAFQYAEEQKKKNEELHQKCDFKTKNVEKYCCDWCSCWSEYHARCSRRACQRGSNNPVLGNCRQHGQ